MTEAMEKLCLQYSLWLSTKILSCTSAFSTESDKALNVPDIQSLVHELEWCQTTDEETIFKLFSRPENFTTEEKRQALWNRRVQVLDDISRALYLPSKLAKEKIEAGNIDLADPLARRKAELYFKIKL